MMLKSHRQLIISITCIMRTRSQKFPLPGEEILLFDVHFLLSDAHFSLRGVYFYYMVRFLTK